MNVLLFIVITLIGSVPIFLSAQFLFKVRTACQEFKKLVQVPVLKGDLSRVLKVCVTYSGVLSTAFHQMVLKVRNPWAIDLQFQEGMAVYQHAFLELGSKLVLCRGIFLGLMGCLFLASPSTPYGMGAILLCQEAFAEYTWYKARMNLSEQIVTLYDLRSLLYMNASKVGDALGSPESFVPPRYQGMYLSGHELAEYRERMSKFVADTEQRKAAGEVFDTTTAWNESETAAGYGYEPDQGVEKAL